MSAQRVGVAGLGSMGMSTALALLDAGFTVAGYDVDGTRVDALARAGGVACESPRALAAHADRVLTMVVDAAQVESVLFAEEGLAGAFRGGLLIQSATVAPDWIRAFDERLAAIGIEVLDAPVGGGPVRAREGNLWIALSGPPARRERAADVFDATGANLFVMGDEIGQGSATQMVCQLLAGVHVAVAGEAMAFALASGLDAQAVYRAITASSGNSWMFESRVPHVLDNDYAPQRALEVLVKDLDLVLGAGRAARFPLPMTAQASQLFAMACAAGLGREDDAAVVKVWQRIAGITLPGGEG